MIVGKLAKFTVTASASMYRKAATGSKCSMLHSAAPASRQAKKGSTKLMWNIGSGSHIRSAAVSSKRVRPASDAVRTNASWESGHPFGMAVVPDVYIMIATSRIETCDRRRSISRGVTDAAMASKTLFGRVPG